MMEPQETIFFFSVAGRSHFLQVLQVWIHRTSDSQDCKSFLLKTGFWKAQVLFKTDLTVHYKYLLTKFKIMILGFILFSLWYSLWGWHYLRLCSIIL